MLEPAHEQLELGDRIHFLPYFPTDTCINKDTCLDYSLYYPQVPMIMMQQGKLDKPIRHGTHRQGIPKLGLCADSIYLQMAPTDNETISQINCLIISRCQIINMYLIRTKISSVS